MPCGRSAAARSGQRPSVVTSVLATTVLLTNASVQAPCPVVALRHFEHAAGPVGCGDVVREILLISQHDAAARDTDKVHARLGHMSQRLNHTTRSPRVASRRRLAARASGSIAMACPMREHGAPLLCGDCGGHRARSWSTRRDVSSPDHCELSLVGCCPATRAPIRRTSGICISITLSISTSAGVSRPQCALMMA